MSSYLNLAVSLLLEICCCPQSNKAQMLTQILINKDLPSIFSVKPVLIRCSGPDETLSQSYYSETEQDGEYLPAEEDRSSSSSRTRSNEEISFPFSVQGLESRHSCPWDKGKAYASTKDKYVEFPSQASSSRQQVTGEEASFP